MKLRKKQFTTHQHFISAIKREWKTLLPELVIKMAHSMENRIYEVIKSDGDFVLH